jgi:AsmA family protein
MMAAMNNFFTAHRKTKWFCIVLGACVLILALFIAFFDWNALRPAVARLISEKTGRAASIEGNLKVHIWSWNPSAEVDGLTVKNPKWAQHDLMFRAERLTVSVSLGRLLRGQLVLPKIEVVRPVVDLERDAAGRASWEFGNSEGKPQNKAQPAKLPAIRRLLIEDGNIRVSDRIRKLVLSGSLNAADEASKESGAGFKLRCTGSLNEKPFRAQLSGGPIINLEPNHPYDLEAHLTASDITLDAHVSFPKPFDLASYQLKFTLSGGDLADVYYLTGLALPNTPPYRLAADVKHSGTLFRMENLKGRVGSSDLEGDAEIETAASRPKFSAKLRSNTLNIVDVAPTLGHPASASNLDTAAPGASQPPGGAAPAHGGAAPTGLLLPDADLQVDRVRGMDADVTYHARAVTAARMPTKEVSFHLVLKDGVLELNPLSFVLDSGTFSGSVAIDARKDVPESTIDMRIDNVDLSQFKSAKEKEAPLKGSLVGRLKVHGSGASVHKLASSAEGSISAAVPTGEMNDAVAEATEIDVMKGLGLLLSPNQPNTQVRCGVVDFQAQDGTLASKSVFIDTTNVLITGHGTIDLRNEHLDLSMQGDPKKVRLFRLRSPITLHGTLLHPAVGVKADKLAAQAGVAAALATLLTPFAAAIAFIDPGLAKNKDCAAVIAEAQANVSDDNASANAKPPSVGNPVGALPPGLRF